MLNIRTSVHVESGNPSYHGCDQRTECIPDADPDGNARPFDDDRGACDVLPDQPEAGKHLSGSRAVSGSHPVPDHEEHHGVFPEGL